MLLQVIGGRSKAYAYMLKGNYPKDALAKMRLSLVGKEKCRDTWSTGWQESPLLPPGWLYRDTSTNGRATHFLSSEGDELKSQMEARELIERDGRYSAHQLDFFNRFMKARLRTMTVRGYAWTSSSTVPEGWRVRRTAGKNNDERLLSPEGKEVRSRRAAVQFLFSTKASHEKLAEMVACLKHEGWESSQELPIGWTFKKVSDHQVDSCMINETLSNRYCSTSSHIPDNIHSWLWERIGEYNRSKRGSYDQ